MSRRRKHDVYGDRDIPGDVLAVLELLADALKPAPASAHDEPGALHHLDYERYVEQPRRRGIDPAYQALMAEALAHSEQHHKAAS